MVPKKLLRALAEKRNKVFCVFAHVHLEGDALGAELAAACLLRALGKKVYVINEDAPPAEYGFLPGLGSIARFTGSLPDHDAVLFVDCSDMSRAGSIAKKIRRDRPILNIDHHVSNTRFGSVNWVEPSASSASEMIYELFGALKVPLTRSAAVLLYTGILTDTGSFRYTTTSARTHQVAAALMRFRIEPYDIYRALYEDMSFKTVRLLGEVLKSMRRDRTGKVAWLVVSSAQLKADPTLYERTDDIIRFARCVRGVEVALLFKEVKPGLEVRVNLRSSGRVDVNAIARLFGGGGHRMASGCTVASGIKAAVANVTAEAVRRCS